jgi:hypothetical protein
MQLHKLILWGLSAFHLMNGLAMMVSPERTTTFWMGEEKLTTQRINDLTLTTGWDFVISSLFCALTQFEDPAQLKRALLILCGGLAMNAGNLAHMHCSVDLVSMRLWLATLAELGTMMFLWAKPATTLPGKTIPITGKHSSAPTPTTTSSTHTTSSATTGEEVGVSKGGKKTQ